MTATNGAQQIVALAKLAETTPYEVERDDYSISFKCDYPFKMTLPTDTPVYTFEASVERVESIEPWVYTVATSDLPGEPLLPYLSFCTVCS